MSDRLDRLQHWTRGQLGWPDADLKPASADASFRRYFRVQQGDESYVLMDAPPEKEDCGPFIHVSRLLLALGLHVPEILASDLEQRATRTLDEHRTRCMANDRLLVRALTGRTLRDASTAPSDTVDDLYSAGGLV